jgi:hypothetical protein
MMTRRDVAAVSLMCAAALWAATAGAQEKLTTVAPVPGAT